MVKYDEAVAEIEGVEDMSYAARIEQKGVDKGIQQGLQQGLQQEAMLLIQLLKHRFGDVPASYLLQIQQAPHESLLIWAKKLLDAQSIEEVFS